MGDIFSRITSVDLPEIVPFDPETGCNQAFEVIFWTNGHVPFPQIIFRNGWVEHFFREGAIFHKGGNIYVAMIRAGVLHPGAYDVQIEGCRVLPLENAKPQDWIKWFTRVKVEAKPEIEYLATAETVILDHAINEALSEIHSTSRLTEPRSGKESNPGLAEGEKTNS